MNRPPRVTARDVARLAGVSRNTVSLTMRDSPLVLPETKERVLAVVERLGYQPHAAAAALRSARSNTLGYLMRREPEAEVLTEVDVFRNRIWHAITDVAEKRDHFVLQSGLTDARHCRALLSSGRIDGLLVDLMVPDDLLAELAAAQVPVMSIGRTVDVPGVGWVKADEASGAQTAVEHLVALGHRRIGIISVRQPNHPIVVERETGFSRALEEHGLNEPAGARWYGDWTFESGFDLATSILRAKDRPTALFVLDELMAAGCLKAARELGLVVPRDLSVLTVEDSLWVNYIDPPLTAVHVPMYDVARIATEAMLDALAGTAEVSETEVTVPTSFVVRASTAPPPQP